MCLRFGEQDPEQWLEDVPDRVWDLWKAYYSLEPFGGERALMAKMIVILKQLLASKFSADTATEVIASVERLAGSEMPWEWIDQPEPEPESDPIAKFEAVVAGMYGHNH